MNVKTSKGNVVSDEQIEEWAEACERGEYPGEPTGEVTIGRPLKFGEALKPVTFKETAYKILLMDIRASALNLSRSDYLRQLVDADLASAS